MTQQLAECDTASVHFCPMFIMNLLFTRHCDGFFKFKVHDRVHRYGHVLQREDNDWLKKMYGE